ncbi:hypothetical protein [Alistipes sp.]|uniref:hypothetical protein n=1 Tax=Alistipes sp. TaxID=1872444 RepID=UPI003AB8F9C3
MKKSVVLLACIIMMSCSGRPHMKPGASYPEMISPIYFLDTFQIRNPLVAFIDSEPYIASASILKDSLDKKGLLARKGVIRYLTDNLASDKTWDYVKIYNDTPKADRRSFYSLQSMNEFIYIEDNLKFFDSIKGVAVYSFDIEPQNFLLTLIAREDSLITSRGGEGDLANDVILGVEYSNDYMLAIAPLFSAKNRKILNQRYVEKHLKDK